MIAPFSLLRQQPTIAATAQVSQVAVTLQPLLRQSSTGRVGKVKEPIVLKLLRALGSDVESVYPGHFHSAIPSRKSLKKREAAIWNQPQRTIPGIDLREDEQLKLLHQFEAYYAEQPWSPTRSASNRYYFENGFYCHSDGLFLYYMMRHFRPKRIMEAGSGFSTAAMLDVNERFFENSIELTCIEPHPERLQSLLRQEDRKRIVLLDTELQDVPLQQFQSLEAGDFLFIDSTHVLKIGSDVHYLLSQILPSLQPGVYVHIHDIFYPFQYPRTWVMDSGMCWNEAYALQAFLQFNNAFQIVMFNTFLEEFHKAWFEEKMPLCLRNKGGSIWIRRNP